MIYNVIYSTFKNTKGATKLSRETGNTGYTRWSSVWDPHLQKHIYQIEMAQRRTARFIKHEYSRDPGIITSVLQELELQALQERRKTSRLLVFHKITLQKVAIPLPPYLQKPTRTDSTIPSKKMRKDRLNWRSAETQLLCT